MAVMQMDQDELLLPGISVNRMSRTITLDERTIKLTFRELDIFYILARNPYKVFSRQQLLKEIWHDDSMDIEKVAVHMARLRKKLNPDRYRHQYIRTIWGAGYMFDPRQR